MICSVLKLLQYYTFANYKAILYHHTAHIVFFKKFDYPYIHPKTYFIFVFYFCFSLISRVFDTHQFRNEKLIILLMMENI